MVYHINIIWDDEADVWVATSNDVPDLILEHGSADALIERVRAAATELLALSGKGDKECELAYTLNRTDSLAVYG